MTDTDKLQLEAIERRLAALETVANRKQVVSIHAAWLRTIVAILVVLGAMYLAVSGVNIPGELADLLYAALVVFMAGDASLHWRRHRIANDHS
jgi:quinol-cytochrome oxidoreductase complex cytochrome b subunit